MITATSADVDWRTAVAAIAAGAEAPVAVVIVGAPGPDALRAQVDGLVFTDRLSLERARDLVVAVSRAYPLVLLAAPAGLLVPLGDDGWTLADLTAEVNADALVVTGPGPDSVNHTTLAIGALAGHGISASVITLGAPAEDTEGIDEAKLPVTPIGRIPADPPKDFAGAAAWFDPALFVKPEQPPVLTTDRTVSGKRFVTVLISVFAVFIAMILLACGIAWWGGDSDETPVTVRTTPTLYASIGTQTTVHRPAAADVCPQNAPPQTVTHPDRATTARVDAAWLRIEKWLATHAPAGLKALGRPATTAQIDALQRRMSVPFPPDLVASLRRHNGATSVGAFSFPPFYAPQNLDRILGDWLVKCEVLAGSGSSWADDWWHKQFVPFADAGDGGSLLTDQRPGGHGRVGESYPDSGTTFDGWPASVAELLELTASSLETGKPVNGHYRPEVDTQGGLDWEIT